MHISLGQRQSTQPKNQAENNATFYFALFTHQTLPFFYFHISNRSFEIEKILKMERKTYKVGIRKLVSLSENVILIEGDCFFLRINFTKTVFKYSFIDFINSMNTLSNKLIV